MKKRMLMLFVCMFAIAPAALAGEIRNTGVLTKGGRTDCEVLRKAAQASNASDSKKNDGKASGVSLN